MIATVENMRKVAHLPGVFACDPSEPWERCSASPGDYFWLGNEPLTNDAGESLILAREVCRIEEVTL